MVRVVRIGIVISLVFQISAHYLFGTLLVNGTASRHFQYVRDVTPNDTYTVSAEFGKTYPHYDRQIYSSNFTCGRNAIKFANKTETATIVAGTGVGFRVVPHYGYNIGDRYNNTIFHEGPGYIYAARAPSGSLKNWVGDDGDWFKIAEWLAANASSWKIDPKIVRSSMPPGKYLLRVEQFTGIPYLQFYVNCAHVNIVGGADGIPGPCVKFPGAYDYARLEHDMKEQHWLNNHTNFKGIGPPLWSGQLWLG